MPVLFTTVASPLDELLLLGDAGRGQLLLTAVYCTPHQGRPDQAGDWRRDDAAFRAVTDQLAAYFAGDLQTFDVPLDPRGTPFQQEVWTALRRIPYGTTTSYGALALELGRPLGAARAIGLANGRNPLSILVPCHRVVGSAGTLVGYGGGIPRKQWLLAHEARVAGAQPTLF